MAHCVGAVISVNCGPEGIYQGKLLSVDTDNKRITLGCAFKDGLPMGKSMVLDSSQIASLKVLKSAADATPKIPQTPPASISTEPKTSSSEKRSNGTCTNGSVTACSSSSRAVHSSETNRSGSRTRRLTRRRESTTDESDTSSGDAHSPPHVHRYSQQRYSGREAQRAKSKSTSKKSTRQGSSMERGETSSGGLPEIAPTPLFRKYEPQVPRPLQLTANVSRSPTRIGKQNNRKRDNGPCGIPALDALGVYGRIQGRNNDLNKPIDFDLLDTDFDFETNLKLFEDEDIDEELYEEIEKPKMSKNFAHFENIVNDPKRITSWTNIIGKTNGAGDSVPDSVPTSIKKSSLVLPKCGTSTTSTPLFESSSFEVSSTGVKIPMLEKSVKRKLLRNAERYLGSDVFQSVCADRVLNWIMEIAKSNSLPLFPLCLFASDSISHQLVDRLLIHLSNRKIQTYVYGFDPTDELPFVNIVESVGELPKKTQLSVCLTPHSIEDEVASWLVSTDCHVITLETNLARVDRSKIHLLQLCCLTVGVSQSPSVPIVGRTSFAALAAAVNPTKVKVDMAVADLGIPFGWFNAESKSCLVSAFQTKLLTRM